MASSYSTDLKLELMVTGENAGTWGDNTNNNLNLIQQAIAGYEAVALSDGGTVALAMTDKTISNARNMVIKFTGTLTSASIVTIPDSIEKFYIFDCSAVVGPTNLTIKTASGTGFTLNAAKIFAAYSDGTNLNEISLETLGGTIAFADVTGTVSTSQIADNAITSAKISDNQIITAKISDNQITSAKISDNQITTAKIANDAVGPDQLSDTAVTPGAYTTADITVDAQGRITAAASGEAGGGAFQPAVFSNSGGTYNAQSGANFIGVLAVGGGGGGGGGHAHNPGARGGRGGVGGYGFWGVSVSTPYSVSYNVGSGGNGGALNSGRGNAGGATGISGATANGGNGGRGVPLSANGSNGTAGSTPGSDYNYGNTRGLFGINGGNGGAGGRGNAGSAGNAGQIIIWENTGS